MNDTNLKDYLFSEHYKPWPVSNALKTIPALSYQEWIKNPDFDSGNVIIAFGSKSGQIVSLDEAQYIKLFPYRAKPNEAEYYYIHKSDVFYLGKALDYLGEPIEQTKPQDYVVCMYHGNHKVYHPIEDIILTESNQWYAKEDCVELCRDFYCDDDNNPIWVDTNQTRETHNGEIIKSDDAIYCESDGSFYHQDEADECLHYNDSRDYYVHPDDDNVRWCVDIDQYALDHDCHYCHLTEDFYFYEHNLPKRDHTQSIQDYHCGVEPEFKVREIDQNNPLSKYTIGFEVEKDCLDNGDQEAGSLIVQQPLFSHWETDSSCGIEGITNVYSLDNESKFNADCLLSDYLNLNTNGRCGGHINFAHRENKMQYWHIRPWLGLIFSMWKRRLTNQYSSCNKKLNPYRATDHHYGALVEKGRMRNNVRFELRLPNRVKDCACIIRRFKLMQGLLECVDHYINEDFVWMTNSYDDTVQGIPNWMYTDDNVEWNIKIEELLANISKPTQARTRFFVEKAKDMLLTGYAPENHKRVLAFAYAFQSYIDEEEPSKIVRNLTDNYILN